ncbi:MAG: hypothetical protein LJE91_14750 [Gammaproteobacteria bacterium]|nr:hypothetical protein [Gammaproteobacteria bacterium]
MHDAVREQKTVQKTGACLSHNNKSEVIDIDVVPLPKHGDTFASYLVLFRKISEHEETTTASRPRANAKAGPRDTRIETLERELDSTRQNMQSMIAEREATNEELETAKEGLQSTNEELITVNEELKMKLDAIEGK